MTKIKDLATVLTENVFINLPIDSERYELWCLVRDMIEKQINPLIDTVEGSGKEYLVRYLQQLDSILFEASESFVHVHCYEDPEFYCTKMDQDRSRRVEATIRFWLPDVRWTRAQVACTDAIQGYLWDAFRICWKLADTRMLSRSSNGQEVST